MTAERFLKTCPKCGSHLMLREGEYGDFLACPRFPRCRYTESLRSFEELELREGRNPFCKKCNFTGLLPFKRKDDSIAPHVFLDCDCRLKDERECYQPIKPEDFDFPVSYDFHRSLCREYGWPDSGDLTPNIETHEPIVTQHIRIILDKKALELQNRIVALEEEVKGLRSNKKERKYTII